VDSIHNNTHTTQKGVIASVFLLYVVTCLLDTSTEGSNGMAILLKQISVATC